MHFLSSLGASLIITALSALAAPAQDIAESTKRSERIAELMRALPEASEDEAVGIETELYMTLSQSGSPAMDLLLKRGRDAIADGDFLGAIDHLTALTDHAPDFAEGWNERAMAFFALDMYGRALDDIRHVLVLNPNHFGAMAGLALIREQAGDYAGALEVWNRIETIHPHLLGLKDNRARVARMVGEARL